MSSFKQHSQLITQLIDELSNKDHHEAHKLQNVLPGGVVHLSVLQNYYSLPNSQIEDFQALYRCRMLLAKLARLSDSEMDKLVSKESEPCTLEIREVENDAKKAALRFHHADASDSWIAKPNGASSLSRFENRGLPSRETGQHAERPNNCIGQPRRDQISVVM